MRPAARDPRSITHTRPEVLRTPLRVMTRHEHAVGATFRTPLTPKGSQNVAQELFSAKMPA